MSATQYESSVPYYPRCFEFFVEVIKPKENEPISKVESFEAENLEFLNENSFKMNKMKMNLKINLQIRLL